MSLPTTNTSAIPNVSTTAFSDVTSALSSISSTPPTFTITPTATPTVTPTVKPTPISKETQFINYGDLYKSPRKMNMLSEYLIGDYADALVTGNSPVYINPPNILPGNRYFLNTNSKCRDASNNLHERSIVIDNVLETLVDTSNTENNKGLMYSFLASMESLAKNTYSVQPTPSPIDYLKDASGYSALPLCVPVSIYLDDTKTTDASGWIAKGDRDEIDPLAIKEGFSASDGLQQPSSINQMTGALNSHIAQYNSKMNAQINTANSNLQKVQSESSQKLSSAKVSAMSTGTQLTQESASSVASSKKSAEASNKKRMAAMNRSIQGHWSNAYYEKYGNMPMATLFETFVQYKSPTQTISSSEPTSPFSFPDPIPKQLSADCFISVLTSVPVPSSIPNTYTGLICPTADNLNIHVDTFIRELIQEAKNKQGQADVTLTLPSQYIPKKTTCTMTRTAMNMSGVQFISGQAEQLYTYTQKQVPYSGNYDAFNKALEPYRKPIINAFLSLDYPTHFPPCPNKKDNSNSGMEGFALYDTKANGNIPLYFALIIIIIVIFVVYCVR